jgi:hypothetical protein
MSGDVGSHQWDVQEAMEGNLSARGEAEPRSLQQTLLIARGNHKTRSLMPRTHAYALAGPMRSHAGPGSGTNVRSTSRAKIAAP